MSKKTTMSDIARIAGVSSTAVSFALNDREGISDETRTRILAIANATGWRPNAAARALSAQRANVVGLALTRPPRQVGANTFYMNFIAGLEAELSTGGSSLLFHIPATEEDEAATYKRWASEARVDGLVIMDLRINDGRLALLDDLAIPNVVVGHPRHAQGHVAVWTDDEQAISNAIGRLYELGHRRLARVGEKPQMAHTTIRTQAFLRTCAELDLPTPVVLEVDASAEAAVGATEEILSRKVRPTAVLYDSDVMAIAGLKAAQAKGIDVPGRLSILSYDDSLLCEIASPGVSAFSHDVYAYGVRTAQCLRGVIDGNRPAETQLDAIPTFIERGSTGPATPR
jgi:DNA-binding LacI/PurR family transcriptional regulator